MSNKVFQLLGEIIINYSKSEIDQATQDAKKLKEELEGIETQADEAGEAISSTGDTGSTALGKNSGIGIYQGDGSYDIMMESWIFFDIGSTLGDEAKAHEHRIFDMISELQDKGFAMRQLSRLTGIGCNSIQCA